MARKFSELRDKMSSESRARSEVRSREIIAEIKRKIKKTNSSPTLEEFEKKDLGDILEKYKKARYWVSPASKKQRDMTYQVSEIRKGIEELNRGEIADEKKVKKFFSKNMKSIVKK